ncbi:MAG TPA: iron-containing alcohol dehydrogenase [Miltoncostaea sp.]|nr:iron-containing alcohol dehydrogenase [Miltoncostaea sp.]
MATLPAASAATAGFRHVETGRTIVFGRGAVAAAADLLGAGYTLLSTRRAIEATPEVAARAGAVVEVAEGRVEDVAAEIRASVRGARLVALGGGRVVDVAKALAAADAPRQVVAIPTSPAGAEMTGVHRHALGVPDDTPRVRPDVVVNDPALSASQPVPALAASSGNALGHAVTGLLSARSTPIGAAVAREAILRMAAAWAGEDPDREAVALGALLAGWAVDASGLGPHHALAQSAVRTAGLGHAQANVAILPATVRAARRRRPAELDAVERAFGVRLETLAERLRDRAGADLGGLTTDDELLEAAVRAAAGRPELDRIPPAPDHAEIRAIYRG